MLNRMKAIFFGNGLNRIDNSLDWEELLKKISSGKLSNKEIPNTLQYESILLSKKIGGGTDKEISLKKEIAKELCDLKTNEVYVELVNAPVSEYITTNYDVTFEKALVNAGFKRQIQDSSEAKYSVHRCRLYEKGGITKRIWYIHGEVGKPNSIMIGYDHYCGSLAKINAYVKGAYSLKRDLKKVVPMVRKLNNMKTQKIESWIDLFFMSDLYFVGAGLAYEEIDVWWLLNMRARMIDEENIKKQNNIVFYGDKNDDNGKSCLLESFGVFPKFEKLSPPKDFKHFYLDAIKNV